MNLTKLLNTFHKLWMLLWFKKVFCFSIDVYGMKVIPHGNENNITSTQIPNYIRIDLENDTVCTEDQPWSIQDIPYTKPYSICYSDKELPRSWHVPFTQHFPVPQDRLPSRNGGVESSNTSLKLRDNLIYVKYYNVISTCDCVANSENGHGGAVFLYHPCAPIELINALKIVARNCTWRHVISSYPSVLNRTYPLGIVTYGCEYRMSGINTSDIKVFMENRSISPEAGITRQGTYEYGLLKVSNAPKHNAKSDQFCEDLIEHFSMMKLQTLKRSDENVTTEAQDDSKTPRTGEAAWAIGSLLFLLIGLVIAVCYTQLWRKGNHGESFEHTRVWNDESQPGSVSIAAIIRKFPNMLRSKMDRVRSRRVSRDRQYQRIQDESYSEDEV